MTFVVDSTVALTWCFAEECPPTVAGLLDQVADGGAFAPSLWPLEVLHALRVAERRGRVDTARRHELTRGLQTLPVAIDAETVPQAWVVTAWLAERYDLTVYSASYLELAQRLHLPLATLDPSLRTAATAVGVPLLGAPEDMA